MRRLSMIILIFLMNLLTWQTTESLNFLLIVIDDLRPALGSYGDASAYTPNIDKLAESSVLFSQTYAQQSLCAPSRNSLLTSRRPDTLRLYDFYNYWRDTVGNFTTLPQHLKNNGYVTKSIGKIFHPGISSNYSDDSPYSWTDKPFHPRTNRYKNSPVCPGFDASSPAANLVCPVSVASMPRKTLPDLEILKAAKIFIKNHTNDERPFFLAVGFEKPHIPLKYPQEYLNYHPLSKFNMVYPYEWPKNVSNVAYNPWTDIRQRDDVQNLQLKFPWEKIPVGFAKTIIQSYYAAVTYVDDLVGMLLDELRCSNIQNDTVVLLTSDHVADLLWGDDGRTKKRAVKRVLQMKENSAHPERPRNVRRSEYRVFKDKRNVVRVDAMVELVDIFPTIAEMAGVPIPICPEFRAHFHDVDNRTSMPNLCSEGVSLIPLIKAAKENQVIDWKSGAFSQYPRPGVEPTAKPNSDKPRLRDIAIMGYSLRTKDYRYTAWIRFIQETKMPDWSTILAEELYDHTVDWNENLNVAMNPQFYDVKVELRKLLRSGWRKALPDAISF
ncbi:iduronate 2-sulfatase isoform X2 [Venturia canescens]|uniref:iduronate 2-sulfatase isoform X2 n=1 Tax=Venturia canescens TaxID=32260 RepID=UPI001C9BFC33|nr:iduronate 2-sulfatase isoform X2 [Venturia canescens]